MTSRDELAHYLLVDKARHGDQVALGELIRQHRESMLKWANQIVRNPVKAEDIVQDALIQTLRRIDSLENPHKFLPWLRILVRNQSLMALRTSAGRRELPYEAELLEEASNSMLYNRQGDDPFLYTISQIALQEVESKLLQLGDREREIVKAHLLTGLTINETTERLSMKNSAVYTALSRARTKLSQARYEDEIGSLLASRRRSGKPDLSPTIQAKYLSSACVYDTMSATMLMTAAAMGQRKLSMTEVMASTGHAFRLSATPDLGISGPYAYDWVTSVKSGWSNLGLSVTVYGGPGARLRSPDELSLCMEGILSALERGIPVMAWNMNNAEFGLITGFNDRTQEWTIIDTAVSNKRLPYRKLLDFREQSEWFIAIPKKIPASGLMRDPLAEMISQAVRNLRGPSLEKGFISSDGIHGYRLWIDAFHRQQAVDPLSVAYNIAVAAESRGYASRFFRSGIMTDREIPRNAISAFSHAAYLFASISEDWNAVAKLFPLPFGADPTAPGPADRAARLLDRAASAEIEATDALEEAAWQMNRVLTRKNGDVR